MEKKCRALFVLFFSGFCRKNSCWHIQRHSRIHLQCPSFPQFRALCRSRRTSSSAHHKPKSLKSTCLLIKNTKFQMLRGCRCIWRCPSAGPQLRSWQQPERKKKKVSECVAISVFRLFFNLYGGSSCAWRSAVDQLVAKFGHLDLFGFGQFVEELLVIRQS